MISIGSVIKKLRTVNNISQKEISEKLGISCQTISKWENNKTYPAVILQTGFIEAYPQAFNCGISQYQ